MKTDFEQRLQRLEETVFGVNERLYVTIDVPGVPRFEMAVKQERDENGERITDVSYKDAIIQLDKMNCRLMTVAELQAIKHYVIKERPHAWRGEGIMEDVFGVKDFNFDEWVYDCNEIAGLRWNDGAYAGRFALRLDNGPARRYYGIGFRCCR